MSVRVLVAVDKYKGCLPARAVARHLGTGLARTLATEQIRPHPVSDGGDGFATELTAHGFELASATVADPIGRPVAATFAIGHGTAVIEMAASSGLTLLATGERAPLHADTYGLGMLVRAALAHQPERVVVGAGGSATSDGGAGALAALGARYEGLPAARGPRHGPRALRSATRVDLEALVCGPGGAAVEIATDVTNPLLGPDGAAAVFGPQKGASPADVEVIEDALGHWADLLERATGRRRRAQPRTGAAGGTAFGMSTALDATLTDGLDTFARLSGLDEAIAWADVVITGEGSLDAQTTAGKAPAGVLRHAQAAGTPCWAVVGRSTLTRPQVQRLGFVDQASLTSYAPDESASLTDARYWLEHVGRLLGRHFHERGPDVALPEASRLLPSSSS